ncbi:MAG: hypothetical protein KME12_02170 [Trichocoleus desertorum ATA4-8-CV12]|nr:hypothetical protein [Trichocoleus desertorum ATA4-8-CV12]
MPHQFLDLTFQAKQVWQKALPYCLSVLALAGTGCSEAKAPVADLSFQVKPAGRSGVYAVSGSTNLPDQSQITVAAIRYLSASNTAPIAAGHLSSELSSQLTYTVLSRQNVAVNQGKWQTSLNLWQVAPNGQVREGWQLNQPELKLPMTPAPDVVFLATFEPANQPATISQKLQEQGLQLEGNLARFTTDGQRYLQVSQALPVALPTGKTVPPAITAADINGGWGDRAGSTPQQSNTEDLKPAASANISQTTAPLSPDQQLR